MQPIFVSQWKQSTTKVDEEEIVSTNQVQKPPLGLMPRWISVSNRASAIVAAITRYNAVSEPVPQCWREELAELNVWLEKEGYNQYAAYEPK
jgi:hypothetical protein